MNDDDVKKFAANLRGTTIHSGEANGPECQPGGQLYRLTSNGGASGGDASGDDANPNGAGANPSGGGASPNDDGASAGGDPSAPLRA